MEYDNVYGDGDGDNDGDGDGDDNGDDVSWSNDVSEKRVFRLILLYDIKTGVSVGLEIGCFG